MSGISCIAWRIDSAALSKSRSCEEGTGALQIGRRPAICGGGRLAPWRRSCHRPSLGVVLGVRRVGWGRRRTLLADRGDAAGAGAGLAQHRAAEHAARTTGSLRNALRGEIIGDAALLFGRGRVDQPHQQEERHHRGDEVGIGDFPRAAVMAAVPAFLHAFDDDRAVACHGGTPLPAAGRLSPGFPRSRTSPNFEATACLKRVNRALRPRGTAMSFDTRAFRQALGIFPRASPW